MECLINTNVKKGDNGPRANREITAQKVRLIDPDGGMIGVVTIQEAMIKAREFGLDLVEISPNADPPVCKIINFGKYKYEAQKRANEAKKKQKVVSIKEIKLRPNIGPNDYSVKLRSMVRFLEEGDKVKVTLKFRGREIAHQDIAFALMDRMVNDITEHGKVELSPRMEGKQLVMMIVPK